MKKIDRLRQITAFVLASLTVAASADSPAEGYYECGNTIIGIDSYQNCISLGIIDHCTRNPPSWVKSVVVNDTHATLVFTQTTIVDKYTIKYEFDRYAETLHRSEFGSTDQNKVNPPDETLDCRYMTWFEFWGRLLYGVFAQ